MPKDSVFKYSTRVKSLTTSSGLDWVVRRHMIAKLISWTMPDFSDAQMRKAILLSVKNAVIFVRYVYRIYSYVIRRELSL